MNNSSNAEIIVAVIPIVGIVMGSVIVFFHLLWSHRRKMLIIQTKQYQAQNFDLDAFSLFAGLLLAVVGLCLTVFLALFAENGMALLGGIIPLACGCALLLFFIINRSIDRRSKN
ncbi:MAG: hypothetical protein LBV68_04545 [Spirochaetaceae bacterium]|jgi:hypothetical protein|nr:hypothetical protein [Spirochaetaceae bacterium]